MRNSALWIAIVTSSICALPCRGAAFNDHTRYALTYYLARSVGYPAMQARQIASADVCVDRSPYTRPDRPGNVAQRVRFHAFADPAIPAGAAASAEVRRQLEALYLQALRDGNPGQYLHAAQDYALHGGADAAQDYRAIRVQAGSALDAPGRTNRLIDATLLGLRRFMRDHDHRAPRRSEPYLMAQLMTTLKSSARAGQRFSGRSATQPVTQPAPGRRIVFHRAFAAVRAEPLPPMIGYRFDRQGHPANPALYALRGASRSDAPIRRQRRHPVPRTRSQGYAGRWRVERGPAGERAVTIAGGPVYTTHIGGFDWSLRRHGSVIEAERRLSRAEIVRIYRHTPQSALLQAVGHVSVYLTLALSADGNKIIGALQGDKIEIDRNGGYRGIVRRAPAADVAICLLKQGSSEQDRR